MSVTTPRFPLYVTGSNTARRALIVLQEGFGVNEHIRDVADRFADNGHFVVAPHLYHRSGSPEVPYRDVTRAVALMSEMNRVGLENDLRATTDFLATLDFDAPAIGAVGFCMGGSVAFFAATLGNVGASVSFYGGGIAEGRMGLAPLVELAPTLVSPWLGLYGDLDTGIPVEQVEQLRVATASTPVTTEIVRYPDAAHGFHCDARSAVYNERDARDAYQRTLDFFAAHLVDR